MRFWWRRPIQRNFVSDLDKFLMEFDKKPEASSESRRYEEARFAKIDWLRDHDEGNQQSSYLWKEF